MSLRQSLAYAIRIAGAEEVSDAMAVMRSAFDPRWGEAWSTGQLADFLRGGGGVLVLADAQPPAATLGFALIRTVADEAELMLLATAAEYRRAGVGRALLHGAMDVAKTRGAARMFLEVRSSNESALALYQAARFNIVGHRNCYYHGPDGQMFDAVTLSRELA